MRVSGSLFSPRAVGSELQDHAAAASCGRVKTATATATIMQHTTVGNMLVENALPEDMRGQHRVLDKKGMNDLLREIAQKHPEQYRDVSKKLSDVGRSISTEFGGYSAGLEHFRKSETGKKYQLELRGKVKQILANDNLTPDQRKQLIVKTVGASQQKQIDENYEEGVKNNNPLAYQVVSGSRGNKMNLASLHASDMLYADHRGDVIPLPVLSSYSEGLKPVEYWSATYGARKGTYDTKHSVADAGFLAKQLNQVSHRSLVVGEDDPRALPNRGLPVDTDDQDSEGSLLAKATGPYQRNVVLSPKILRHLKELGHEKILVRSPLVGGSPDGGVYARDIGVRERGTLPGRGEQVGLLAAQSLAEPVSQGGLSSKHSGGVAGQERAVSGFDAINQLVQIPEHFSGATHAEQDGLVNGIDEAPAGGHHIWVDDKRHYVPVGVKPTVHKGDRVEAGDLLSEGAANPETITRHKGIGEGRRYFTDAYRQAMRDAGLKANRRNIELLSRGMINHVRFTDEYQGHVPDDVVPYSTLEHTYTPRDGHEVVAPHKALGKYLEQPVLHYTIGTKIRPSVFNELKHFGVDKVAVHAEPPPFQSEMVRGMYSLQHDPDWQTRMYGSGLKGSTLDAVHRGSVSDERGTSFIPGLARGVDFGHVGAVRQPEPGTKPPPEGKPFPDITEKEKPKPATTFGRLEKHAEQPKKPNVASTIKPETGSSTVTAGGTPATGHPVPAIGTTPTAPLAQPAMTVMHQPYHNEQPLPNPGLVSGPGLPASPSAPPGQVHPDRKPPGLLGPTDDPEMAAHFVHGGGDPRDSSSGYGGQLGSVARFGSLLDTGAVNTLTKGPGGGQGGGGRDDNLIGGDMDEVYRPVNRTPTQNAVALAKPEEAKAAPPPTIGATAQGLAEQLRPSGMIENKLLTGTAGGLWEGVRRMAGKTPVSGGLVKGFGGGVAGKVLGPLGWGMEAYEGAKLTDQEALARYDAMRSGQLSTNVGLGDVPADTIGGQLLNNAANMGQNAAAVGVAGREGLRQYGDAQFGAVQRDAQEAAQLRQRLADPKIRAQYSPDQLAKDQARHDALMSTHANYRNKEYNFSRDVSGRVQANQDQGGNAVKSQQANVAANAEAQRVHEAVTRRDQAQAADSKLRADSAERSRTPGTPEYAAEQQRIAQMPHDVTEAAVSQYQKAAPQEQRKMIEELDAEITRQQQTTGKMSDQDTQSLTFWKALRAKLVGSAAVAGAPMPIQKSGADLAQIALGFIPLASTAAAMSSGNRTGGLE